MLRQDLHGGHVDLIEIGPLLAIDLDADEVFAQNLADFGILEALVLHDVAPVARGVADREKDRAIELLGGAQGFFAPGEPIDGVVGVLFQVGAGLVDQAIWLARGVGHGGAFLKTETANYGGGVKAEITRAAPAGQTR